MAKPEERAARLLDEWDITEPPVPVEQLARHLGARIQFEPFDDDMSGMLYRETDRVIIGINSAHPHTRQRFTIGHEIGHLVLHDGQAMFVDKAVRVNLRDTKASLGQLGPEIEANAFAAALLMPKAFINDVIGRLARQDREMGAETLIRELASRFDVSAQAMEYRLANIGIAVLR